jgi:hypothetical protein
MTDVEREIAENEAAYKDEEILMQAFIERARQRVLWGVQSLPNGTARHDDWQVSEFYKRVTDANDKDGTLSWRDVLLEEVFEALAESDTEPLREELIQVIAVAVAWISDLDSDGQAGNCGNS